MDLENQKGVWNGFSCSFVRCSGGHYNTWITTVQFEQKISITLQHQLHIAQFITLQNYIFLPFPNKKMHVQWILYCIYKPGL